MIDEVPTIIERAKLVAKDILAMAETKQSTLYFNDTPHIDLYQPSKALLNLMNEPEIVSVLEYLQRQHYLKFTVLRSNFSGVSDAYDVWPDINSLTSFLRYEEPRIPTLDILPVPIGTTFDKVRAVLTFKGTDILLGRTEGAKSLQYWVVYCTFSKPNKAIKELTILEKYDKENGDIARKRAVRDAVIALNNKIMKKIKLQKDPFIYSSGKVTYVEQETNPYQSLSVDV